MEKCLERSRLRSVCVFLAVGLLAAAAQPAGASVFTVDANGNGANEVDGSDDLAFSFSGSMGPASGIIRAIDLGAESPSGLEASIDGFVDFTVGGIALDFDTMDVLVFDVMLDVGSAPVDEIGVAVGTNPITDPDGAGTLTGGQSPGAIELSPGTALFPGAAFFSFDAGGLSPDNLESGETSSRLFVVWNGGGPQIGQTGAFSISSGVNSGAQSQLVESVLTNVVTLASTIPPTAWRCGFGFELVAVVPLLMRLRQRRRRVPAL